MTRITDAHFRDPSERHGDGHPLATTPEPPVKTELPSPWLANTLWLADPSAGPVEYLEPLKQLGFTQLCVRSVHGSTVLGVQDAITNYIAHGWNVVRWGRVDQMYGSDVRADTYAAAMAVQNDGPVAFAHNVEIRWDDDDNAVYSSLAAEPVDALCTYPGGFPDGAHRYYQQSGVRCILVQTFGEMEPYGISMFDASRWGLSLGYEIVLPMVGTFRGPNGYADAMLQADSLGSLPRHAYLVEQSGWRHISGNGYEWEKLMAGVR